jgi:hypothetical protein
MSHIDFYKHLDTSDPVALAIPMDKLAREVCALNYGAHRFLSAMVHELRARNAATLEKWREEGHIPVLPEYEHSPLADAIEKALNEGHYY